MRQSTRRTGRLIGIGAATVVLTGLGYAGSTWWRYGRKPNGRGRADPLLDRFMPTYEVREYHQTKVRAPAEPTFAVARELDLRRSSLVEPSSRDASS